MSLFHEDITLCYKFNFFTMWSSNNNNSNVTEEEKQLFTAICITTLIQLIYFNNRK